MRVNINKNKKDLYNSLKTFKKDLYKSVDFFKKVCYYNDVNKK